MMDQALCLPERDKYAKSWGLGLRPQALNFPYCLHLVGVQYLCLKEEIGNILAWRM